MLHIMRETKTSNSKLCTLRDYELGREDRRGQKCLPSSMRPASGTERQLCGRMNTASCSWQVIENSSCKVDLLFLWAFAISEKIHTRKQTASVFWKLSGVFGYDSVVHYEEMHL